MQIKQFIIITTITTTAAATRELKNHNEVHDDDVC